MSLPSVTLLHVRKRSRSRGCGFASPEFITSNVPDFIGDLSRYLRAHHALTIGSGLILLTVFDVAFGSFDLVFPNAHVPVAFRNEIPIGFACLGIASFHISNVNDDSLATNRVRRAGWIHLASVVCFICVLEGGAELASGSPSTAIVGVRALLIWSSLAILSGRSFGWQVCWVFPVISVFPLTYWQRNTDGSPRWWDWLGQPDASASSWIILGVLACGACLAFWLTPWRLRFFRISLRSFHQTVWPSRGAN